MTKKVATDTEFVDCWLRHKGYVVAVAQELGIAQRACYSRRRNVEGRLGVKLPSGQGSSQYPRQKEYVEKYGARIKLSIKDGMAVIFGDAHYWPGDRSIAHEALIRFIKQHQPMTIICNGDIFDGARISRHPPTGWSHMPDVRDEIDYCKQMVGEIEEAAPEKAKLVWCMGNHDTRFSAKLATIAPEYVGVQGTDLPDHFPAWNFSWSAEINDSVMVKHRYNNGIHATWNNTLRSGRSIFTNHLHRLAVTPITDYNGRRYGVDCGTLSNFGPAEQKFIYGEDNPFNWGSGFAVATFARGKLLPPELVIVQDGIAYFRGAPV